MICSLLTLAALGGLAGPSVLPETIYVDADLTTGANDGSSWADAYQGSHGLDAALEAREFGDQIWVTGGRYRPSVDVAGGHFTFLIQGWVQIHGGFAGGESSPGERPANGLAPTILDGDLAGDDLSAGGSKDDNSRHVVSLDGASGQIDRVTIEGGFAWGSASFGGAVDDDGAAPSSTEFMDCTFRDNEAQVGGGAVACRSLGTGGAGCRFVGCLFENNFVGAFGGGLYLGGVEQVTLERCEFHGNSAGAGGALCAVQSARAEVTDSLFVDNEARGSFGGGAVFLLAQGELELASSTVFGNRALTAAVGGILKATGADLEVTNSILWGNVGDGGAMGAGNQLNIQSRVTHSHVQGWTFGGTANSSADPMLTDPMGGDFEPLPGSPVIDAAGPENAFFLSVGDLTGKRRRVDDPQTSNTGVGTGEILDIGAVERSIGAIGTMFCRGDLNASGQRGMIDAFGSTTASDNSVVLTASQLPANQFGIFIVSRNLGAGITPSGISICLGGPDIGRFIEPGQVLGTGPGGQFSLALDLRAIPTTSGFAPVLPGQSWSFECWHRDPAGLNGYSFTDATTIVFD